MTRAEAKARIAELASELHEHSHRYHVLDRPTISDAQYDRMFKELQSLEEQFPDLKPADSPTLRVGAAPRAGFRKVRHVRPMLSLDSLMEEAVTLKFIPAPLTKQQQAELIQIQGAAKTQ